MVKSKTNYYFCLYIVIIFKVKNQFKTKFRLMKITNNINTILFFLFIFLPSILISQNPKFEYYYNNKHEILKSHPNSVFSLKNQYGDIKISSWERDTIEIYVKVWVDAPNYEAAEEVFNRITISNYTASRFFNFETTLASNFFSYYDFGISYEIFVPKDIEIKLKNRIGNIELNDIDGKMNIELEHGDFTILNQKKPINESNISVVNGDINVKSIDNSNILHKNGKLFSDKVSKTKIEVDFSKVVIDEITDLELNAQTSGISINKILNSNINSSSSILKIDILSGNNFIESSKNSNIEIKRLIAKEDEIVLVQNQSDLTLGISSNQSYTLHGELENGEINHYQKGKLTIIREGNNLSFSGYYELREKPSSLIIFGKNSIINITN